jgi:hypothetical protein
MRRTLTILILTTLSMLSVAEAADHYTKYKGDKRLGAATEEAALVYVFRPSMMGGAIKTWTFVDDELLGVTRGKGYTFGHVPAGTHVVWSKAENTSAMEVTLEAGETYYFQNVPVPGFGKARVKLIQIDEQDAKKFLKKCSFCEPTDEGRQRAVEIATNRLDRAMEKAEKRKAK